MAPPILRTARLTLRPMTLDDAADLALRRSDRETAPFQGWPVPYPLERAVALIDEMIARGGPALGGWSQFACVRHEDGVIVGDVALYLDDEGHNGEIGYTLHSWARGHGYATEASAAVLDYAFTVWNLHRFAASIDPETPPHAACSKPRLPSRGHHDRVVLAWRHGHGRCPFWPVTPRVEERGA